MPKKMKIQGLEIKSFVTSLENETAVKGGIVATEWCSNGIVYCTLQTCTLDTNCQSKARTCTFTEAPNC